MNLHRRRFTDAADRHAGGLRSPRAVARLDRDRAAASRPHARQLV